mmetsp:Transcript_27307/g.76240  ORF Transcript_27307/g.76240 Transcript_27307/m.76240 type:complete len:456 (+) Transcript_27307:89-1456(+)
MAEVKEETMSVWQVSRMRTNAMFVGNVGALEQEDSGSQKDRLVRKIRREYQGLDEADDTAGKPSSTNTSGSTALQLANSGTVGEESTSSRALVKHANAPTLGEKIKPESKTKISSTALVEAKRGSSSVMPDWHAPWKLFRVISGHTGWVRAVTMDVSNEWFATGSGDRCIKIWDLASGELKLTLTGHIGTVRGLEVSPRHTYMFSCGEDKQVKCWDLESNKVVRHYFGHLSGVYALALHPTLDVLMTGGRDGAVRVWDIRTKANIMVMTGHGATIDAVKAQAADPQVISGGADSTVRCWDLRIGKPLVVLTNHKKSVRALALHPTEFSFVSGGADNIKKWELPEARFVKNFSGHNSIIQTLSVNQDGVLFSGGDNGTMHFWDYKTGYDYQNMETTVQPGSLASEAGILCSTFDRTGQRLICGEADKTIKIYKQDDDATPESHPILYRPTKFQKRW